MAIIGVFEKQDTGFTGTIETLALRIGSVRFVKRAEGADYAVQGDEECEYGAAWAKTGKYGPYLSVKLDCPSLLAPINAIMSLTPGDDGSYALRWQRRENGR